MIHTQKYFKQITIVYCLLSIVYFASAQDESSPLLQQKEKQSEIKKIKTCTGTSCSYGKNGVAEKHGYRSSLESYDANGNLVESILYSPEEKISETTRSKYNIVGKLIEEEKIFPEEAPQKHTYVYDKQGRLDYGKVYMDTAIVHTCTYKYVNDRLSEMIVEHHIQFEKDVPAQEVIIYKYDDKGNKIREEDYEIQLSAEKLGTDNVNAKGNYKIKKLISSTDFMYDANSRVTQSIQYADKNCTGKTQFHYDADGNITEEIYYEGCAEKPEYIIKYDYTYY